MVTSNFANRLSGVTLNADLALSASNAHLRLGNGVTVNGTITVSGSNAGLISDTTQTIGGSGTIEFEAGSGSERDLSVEGGTTLTLGENLTVRGGGAMIGGVFFVGGNSFVINRGTILADVPGQVLRIDAGGSGTFTNEGVLTGNSTIAGDIINGGIVQPGLEIGVLTIDGDYTQTSAGTLLVEIEGITPGTHDILAVTGAAILNGSLNANISPSIDAEDGEFIDVFTATSISGEVTSNLSSGFSADVTENSIRVTVVPGDGADVLRDSFNQAADQLRQTLVRYADAFSADADSIAFLPIGLGTLGQAWDLSSQFDLLGQGTLPDITAATDTLPELRTALEANGLTVSCIGDCTSGNQLELIYQPEPMSVTTQLDSVQFGQTSLQHLFGDAAFAGSVDLIATIGPRIEIALNESGFSVTSASEITVDFTVQTTVDTDIGSFGASAGGLVTFAGRFDLNELDGDADGNVTLAELNFDPASLAVDYQITGGDATVDLFLDALDRIDVSPLITNTSNGGDVFQFRGVATLIAQAGSSANALAAMADQWGSVRILNPDIDLDGQDDFDLGTLAENLKIMAIERLISPIANEGYGIGDALGASDIPLTEESFSNIADFTGIDSLIQSAEVQVDRVSSLEEIQFWMNSGVPEKRDIMRAVITVDSGNLATVASLPIDLQEAGITNSSLTASIDQVNLVGQVVVGIDTIAQQPFLYIGNDQARDAATEFTLNLALGIEVADLQGAGIVELRSLTGELVAQQSLRLSGGPDGKARFTDSAEAAIENASRTIEFTASQPIVIFPNRTTEEADGIVVVDDADIGVDLNAGILSVSAASVSVDFGDALSVSAVGQRDEEGNLIQSAIDIQIPIDPTSIDQRQPFGSINNAQFSLPIFPELSSSAGQIEIFPNGLGVSDLTLGGLGTDLSLGTPTVARLTDFQVKIDASVLVLDGQPIPLGTAVATARHLELFPGLDSGEAFDFSSGAVSGSLDVATGAVQLNVSRPQLNVASFIDVTADRAAFSFDPTNRDDTAKLLELTGLQLDLLAVEDLPTLLIESATVRRDGFAIDGLQFGGKGFDFGLGDPTILDARDVTLGLNLDVRLTPAFDFSGSLDVFAESAIVFPSGNNEAFQGSATSLAGQIDLKTLAFQLDASNVLLQFGDTVEIETREAQFAFDPQRSDQQTVARLVGMAARFPTLDSFPDGRIRDELIVSLDPSTQTFTLDISGFEIGDPVLLETVQAFGRLAASGAEVDTQPVQTTSKPTSAAPPQQVNLNREWRLTKLAESNVTAAEIAETFSVNSAGIVAYMRIVSGQRGGAGQSRRQHLVVGRYSRIPGR